MFCGISNWKCLNALFVCLFVRLFDFVFLFTLNLFVWNSILFFFVSRFNICFFFCFTKLKLTKCENRVYVAWLFGFKMTQLRPRLQSNFNVSMCMYEISIECLLRWLAHQKFKKKKNMVEKLSSVCPRTCTCPTYVWARQEKWN